MAQSFDSVQKEHWLLSQHARPSSAVLILEDDDERALIVKANYKAHWTFPGGMIDQGETPKQAAVREVAEEVGLSIDANDVKFGWTAARHSVVADTYQFIFTAKLHPGVTDHIVLQTSEIDDWRLVSKADVLAESSRYAKTVSLWADGNIEGYVEQTFDFSS
ncbi:MAG: NUDIX hydrolase [Candidatus Saccharimonadales bacterium]